MASAPAGEARPGTVMRRWLREPLLQCFAAGALLFGVYWLVDSARRDAITLSDEGFATLLGDFETLTGKAPSPEDREQLIDQYYERELLYREGLRREIFRDDGEVRELIIERMQQRATGELSSPTGPQLVNYYADHIDRYYREASISFEQLRFSSKPENANAIVASLAAGLEVEHAPPGQAKQYPDYGLSMLRGLFGQPLLDVLLELPLAEWRGPFQADGAWHYFRVAARDEPELLPFERVRGQVAADYQADALAQKVRDFVDAHRDEYPLKRIP